MEPRRRVPALLLLGMLLGAVEGTSPTVVNTDGDVSSPSTSTGGITSSTPVPLANGTSATPLANGTLATPLVNGTSSTPLANGTSTPPPMSNSTYSPPGNSSTPAPLVTGSAVTSNPTLFSTAAATGVTTEVNSTAHSYSTTGAVSPDNTRTTMNGTTSSSSMAQSTTSSPMASTTVSNATGATSTKITTATPSTATVTPTPTPVTNSTASGAAVTTRATAPTSANASVGLTITSGSTANNMSTSSMLSSDATGSTVPPTMRTTSKAPITISAPALNFNVTFRIVNKNFSRTLTDRSSSEFKKLRDEVIKALEEAYNCSTCPLGSSYEGSEVVRFSEGSVVAETKSTFKTDSNANAEQVKEQFNNALKDNTINSLRVKDLKVNEILSGSATTTATTTSRAPLVPGWGIALLVLACVILLIVIIILLLIIIYVCRRRSKGQLELLGSRGSYYPMADRSDYPQYTTHTRFTSPNGKQNSYNQMPGNGTNLYSYTNHAVESDNL